MGVLDGFISTWSNARDTFGQGVPATGEQFDKSGPLTTMQSNVESAAPGSRWTGAGASAYQTANADHGKVFAQLAALDKQLSSHVTASSEVVAAGRKNLDTIRKWVVDSAAAVPPGKNHDQMVMQIVNKGLGQLSEVVTKSNGDLAAIGGKIRGLGGEYDALGNQPLAPKAGDGDALGDDKDKDKDEEPTPEEMKDLVERSLHGDEEAAAKVDTILDTIEPNQLQPQHNDPKNPDATVPPIPLSPVQAELISQMQTQMQGKSLDELTTLKNDLGEHGDIIGDSMQVMSDPDVKFPKAVDERFFPGGYDGTEVSGNKNLLPASVQHAIDTNPVSRDYPMDPESTTPITTYPTGDDLRKVSELIQSGDEKFQQGSQLDRSMMDRAIDVIHGTDQENKDHMWEQSQWGDAIAQDILHSAGRDSVVDHDMFTGPDGDATMKAITEHNWTDDGAAARTVTDWIDDASKPGNDYETRLRAGETAQALATHLANGDLLHLSTNGFPPESESVGNRNHLLVQGYAEALSPYQGALVGADDMPGFSAIESPAGSDMPMTRDLFAVIDSDQTAANVFNAHAYDQVVKFQQDFAQIAADGPNIDIADQRSQGMSRAGLLAGLIDGGALTEAGARLDDAKAAADSAYELKKNALGYMVGLGTDKIPFAGGLMDAMGKDALVNSLLGGPPTVQTVDGNTRVETHGDQYYQNLATYTMADALIDKRPDGMMPPGQWMTADGHLKTPEQVLAETNGATKIDDYYRNLYTYLGLPQNYNLNQHLDEFSNQYGNGTKK